MKQDMHTSKEKIQRYLHILRGNAPLIVALFLVAVYGFLGWRAFSLMQSQPSDNQVSSKLQTIGVPMVDEQVAAKILRLKDNSVSVQTLFDQSRKNPFSE